MFKCEHPGCDFTSESIQGIAGHRQKHLSPEDKAKRLAKRMATVNGKKELSADDIFKRVEEATKVLFPDPTVFYERFEEIAELRTFMLQVLKR